VRKEDLIAYARRDWQAIAASKRQRWAEQKSRMSAAEALSVGDELRHHASTLREGWPTEEDRREDLASHIRVAEMLRSVNSSVGR
jgi:GT2 family glycosyltransferase